MLDLERIVNHATFNPLAIRIASIGLSLSLLIVSQPISAVASGELPTPAVALTGTTTICPNFGNNSTIQPPKHIPPHVPSFTVRRETLCGGGGPPVGYTLYYTAPDGSTEYKHDVAAGQRNMATYDAGGNLNGTVDGHPTQTGNTPNVSVTVGSTVYNGSGTETFPYLIQLDSSGNFVEPTSNGNVTIHPNADPSTGGTITFVRPDHSVHVMTVSITLSSLTFSMDGATTSQPASMYAMNSDQLSGKALAYEPFLLEDASLAPYSVASARSKGMAILIGIGLIGGAIVMASNPMTAAIAVVAGVSFYAGAVRAADDAQSLWDQ